MSDERGTLVHENRMCKHFLTSRVRASIELENAKNMKSDLYHLTSSSSVLRRTSDAYNLCPSQSISDV